MKIVNNINLKIKIKYLIFLFIGYLEVFDGFADIYNKKKKLNNKIIKENFFVIDSNNLKKVKSHMYGYSISKEGILTDNYYKKIKKYNDPKPEGVYILIRKIKNKIYINQDFYGSIGLYLYESKETGYFAISNSFFLLEEHLIGKENFTLNKDYADDFIIEGLCTPSINETLVNEITKIPPNVIIIINIDKKCYSYYYIDYKENTIPLNSKEGLNIIDKWVDKWGYIIRSLKKQTNNIYSDLSGGFDTRMVLAMILNSGVDLNDILIDSANDKLHVHEEDFNIASNISAKFMFKLNNFKLDNKVKLFNMKDSLFCSIFSKLGFHKHLYFPKKFFLKPRFRISGDGGGIIKGYPGKSIQNYIEALSSNSKKIKGNDKQFHDATKRICNRSIQLLKKNKTYNNDFEIANDLYFRGRTRAHYGTSAYENFIANIFTLQPLIDSELKKIKLNIKDSLALDIPAYIYIRFAYDLIKFPFQGKRHLDLESIKNAKYLNKIFGCYKKSYNFKKNFYIDNRRKSPASSSNKKLINEDANKFIFDLVKSKKIYYYIHQLYNDSVYKWSVEYINKTKYYPLTHIYSLLAVAKTLENIYKNKQKLGIVYKIKETNKSLDLF